MTCRNYFCLATAELDERRKSRDNTCESGRQVEERKQPPAVSIVPEPGAASDLQGLTRSRFLLRNLLPVTIGNVGGGVLVAAVYWFVGLRADVREQSGQPAGCGG